MPNQSVPVRFPVSVSFPCCRARPKSVGRCVGLVALSLMVAMGCTSARDDRAAVYPVEGSVSFGGKSLEGALIVLHPEEVTDPRVLPARGYVDAIGRFKLTTYESGDGAAAGQYRVTVVQTPLIQRDGEAVAGPNVLPPKYATPTTTELRVRIAAGTNTLPVLELQR
jgi:hypothetical protein